MVRESAGTTTGAAGTRGGWLRDARALHWPLGTFVASMVVWHICSVQLGWGKAAAEHDPASIWGGVYPAMQENPFVFYVPFFTALGLLFGFLYHKSRSFLAVWWCHWVAVLPVLPALLGR